MMSGEIPAAPYKLKIMGIIADSFRETLEVLKRQDEISRQETKRLLAEIDSLIVEFSKDWDDLDQSWDDHLETLTE